MGLLRRLFGSRFSRLPVEAQILRLIYKKLKSGGIPAVADVAFVGPQLMMLNRRLAVTIISCEVSANRVHAHIVSLLPNPMSPQGMEPLDACINGYGPTESAVEQAADLWVQLVAAPLLSYLLGQSLMDAHHFAGEEHWGIPGGHGFVGPFIVRGPSVLSDEELARCEVFRSDGYPRDSRRHLAKAILFGQDGRWKRYLEIDGHNTIQEEEDWQGLPPPTETVFFTRFAVFDMN